MYTVEELRAFEEEVVRRFENGEIRGPVHLSCGNEVQLIEIFKSVNSDDWVFSTWRNHYHALLHGVPPSWLMWEILAGRSININNPERCFYTSAIVGGVLPIAVGVAKALKLAGSPRRVWCFVGDMASTTGIFHETTTYAKVNNLPITFVVEDNGVSTNTPTRESWGYLPTPELPLDMSVLKCGCVWYYRYQRKYPHVGVGKFIHF